MNRRQDLKRRTPAMSRHVPGDSTIHPLDDRDPKPSALMMWFEGVCVVALVALAAAAYAGGKESQFYKGAAVAALASADMVRRRFDLLAWRRRERMRNEQCPHCGYDLRESPKRCPECGRGIPVVIAILRERRAEAGKR